MYFPPRLRSILLVFAALCAAQVQASETVPANDHGWKVHANETFGQGAAVCHDWEHHYFCFALRCLPGAAPEFAILFSGGQFTSFQQVSFAVDGQFVANVPFYPRDPNGELVATMTPENAALAEWLKLGSELVLTLAGKGHAFTTVNAAASVTQAQAMCQGGPQGAAERRNLTAAEVTQLAVGRELSWSAGKYRARFFANGTFAGMLNKTDPIGGTYAVQADGRLCWQRHFLGCFRFYSDKGDIWVRREDEHSTGLLGRVAVN